MTAAGQFSALGFDPAPGDLSRVNASAEQYHQVARKLSSALDAINAIVNQTGIWEGEASEAFARRVDDLPKYLDSASQSTSRASTALADWSESLGVMQRNAIDLEQQARKARQDVESAQSDPSFGLAGQTFNDPAQLEAANQALARAEQNLAQANETLRRIIEDAERLRAQHDEVAQQIAGLIDKARELAPDEPGLLGKGLEALGDALDEAVDDLLDLGKAVAQGITDFIEDNANLIAAFSDVIGDLSTMVGVVADFLPPPFEQVAGAVSVGLGVTALQGHLLASVAGADIPPETFALDAIGIGAGTVGLIPGVPGTLMRWGGTAYVAGQGAGEVATGGEASTFFDNLEKYWAPRDVRQGATYGASLFVPGAALAVPFENAAREGIAADNEGQAERDAHRARERVWD
ncbi:MAG: hypothetical protein GEV04_02550 [Actinophytocola sp.]|nr:hypothetical protein [Actinophytocola sp.]